MKDITCGLILIPFIFIFILNLQFLFIGLESFVGIGKSSQSNLDHEPAKAVNKSTGYGDIPATTTISKPVQTTPIPIGSQPSPPTNEDLDPPRCKLSSLFDRKDCGYRGITEDECLRRNCCWNPTLNPFHSNCHYQREAGPYCGAHPTTREPCGSSDISQDGCEKLNCCYDDTKNLFVQKCFYNRQKCNGYRVLRSSENETSTYLELGIIGDGCAVNGKDIRFLSVLISEDNANTVRIKIYPTNLQRWEIPQWILPDPPPEKINPQTRIYKIDHTSDPFTFKIKRSDTNEILFDTDVKGLDPLVFEDQYMQIATTLPDEANIYGLGEVASTLRRPVGTVATLWNADNPTPENENLYGSHPFYMEIRDGKAHGVFLRNSNAQEVMIANGKLVWKALGGILDFSIFLGPHPSDVSQQYTRIIGRPRMPPLTMLGFQQSRWGYNTIDDVENILDHFIRGEVPLDVIYNDIDYMDHYRLFTWDTQRYPIDRVKAFVDRLHSLKKSYVVVIDPGVAIVPGDETYESGIAADLFIKDFAGKYVTGSVWPGKVHYPDWLHPATPKWWEERLGKFFSSGIDLDPYLWLDMNEAANFCHGDASKGYCAPWDGLHGNHSLAPPPPFEPLDPKLYKIQNWGLHKYPMQYKSLPTDAIHAGGLSEWEVHNLYGLLEGIITRQALLNIKPNRRPFLLSRSTFAGSGRHVFHWNGDNNATWRQMYLSIPMTINMNLFGLPFSGSDICGFNGNTTEELCLRWTSLGAMYPFSRNHNIINAIGQEPYIWESVRDIAQRALGSRYALVPYFYTLLYEASQHGSPVWAPLWYYYSHDNATYMIDNQVMIGEHLLLTPVLEEGVSSVTGYFPKDIWYDWLEQRLDSAIHAKNSTEEFLGGYKELFAPVEKIPLHMRGGGIIPMQESKMTVTETSQTSYSLVVALNKTGAASGHLYFDDGVSENVAGLYTYVSLSAQNNGTLIQVHADKSSTTSTPIAAQQWGYKGEVKKLNTVIIMGAEVRNREIKEIKVGNTKIMYPKWQIWDDSGRVSLESLDIPLTSDFILNWTLSEPLENPKRISN